jgi:hypothetical protein
VDIIFTLPQPWNTRFWSVSQGIRGLDIVFWTIFVSITHLTISLWVWISFFQSSAYSLLWKLHSPESLTTGVTFWPQETKVKDLKSKKKTRPLFLNSNWQQMAWCAKNIFTNSYKNIRWQNTLRKDYENHSWSLHITNMISKQSSKFIFPVVGSGKKHTFQFILFNSFIS